ncbi:MAG: TonB-dependent receptor, partial [Bacteroidota bacterium]
TAQIDLERPFKLGWLQGFVKAGVKLRDQNRVRESFRQWTAFSALNDIIESDPDGFALNADDNMLIEPFFGDYSPVDFLQGDWAFDFGRTLDTAALNAFARTYAPTFYSEDERLRLQNYLASERIQAGYVMGKFTFWDKLTFIPGVRVEQTRTSYEGLFGRSFEQEGRTQIAAQDTVGGQNYIEILPMFHLKYQVKPWFDIRLAATRTLARPDFLDLVPWQEINDIDQILQRGNPNLAHTKVWNYDVFFSFYGNWGLFTLGGFIKELEDVSVTRFSRVREEGASLGYLLIDPINISAQPSTVQGIELDFQGNLSTLPSFWSGFLVGANVTLLRSEAFFPQTNVTYDQFFRPIFTDTLRTGPLPDQPNQIVNLSLGYERKGFTGRVAYFMQTNALSAIGPTDPENLINLGFNRLDVTLKQRIYKGLSVFINANNLTNQRERTAVQVRLDEFGNTRDAWTRNRVYGWTADIGFKWKF